MIIAPAVVTREKGRYRFTERNTKTIIMSKMYIY